MADEQPHKSVMHEVQERMGATFTSFYGWVWSASFGDLPGEHRAVREGVGAADVSALIKWDFRGKDALEAAQRLCTNNILGLRVGQIRYGPFLDADGLVIDDGTVYKHSDTQCWVMTNRADLGPHFEEVLEGLDVQYRDVTFDMPLIQVQGPKSRELLQRLGVKGLDDLRYFWFITEPVEVAGIPVWLSRTGFTSELGYELFVAPEHAPNLWTKIIEAGATPYGAAAADIQRVESGIVVYELDYMPGELTPYDVSFDKLVKLDRDFHGRNAIAHLADDPPRRFKTLVFPDAEVLPVRGSKVRVDGEVRGWVSSPTQSPLFGPIALGILDTPVAAEGQRVEAEDAETGTTVPGTVEVQSVYDPEKRRARM